MESLNGLAKLVVKTVDLTQKKFQNPDFRLSFSINKGEITKGIYTPVLNFPGGETFIYLVEGRGQIALPWLHEDTWRYLKDVPESSSTPSPLVLSEEGKWAAVTEGVSAGQIIFTSSLEDISVYAPTISGGTRTGRDKIEQKMNRQFEVKLKHDIETCPLCTRSEKEGTPVGNLCILKNNFTPYPVHNLIVPTKEFYKEGGDDKIYTGNPEELGKILELGLDFVSTSERESFELYAHRGFFAGQNFGHLHFHLLSFRTPTDSPTTNSKQ